MGRRTLHGSPVTATSNATSVTFANPTSVGPAHQATTSSHVMSWPNTIRGSLNTVTLAVWQRHVGTPTANSSPLFTRGSGVNATGLTYLSTRWQSTWDDEGDTYTYSNGPVYTTEDELCVVVFTGSQIQWWLNGVNKPTSQTYAAAAINWSNCTAWQSADFNGSNNRGWVNPISAYYIWGRTLNGNEIGRLWQDPFCFMRR